MKNVKKLLAVLISAAMLFALVPLGLLQASASYEDMEFCFAASAANENGVTTVSVFIENAVGFLSGDFTITYDEDEMEPTGSVKKGPVFDDHNEIDIQSMFAANTQLPGTVFIGAAFENPGILSLEDFYAEAEDIFDDFDPSYDPDHCELFSIKFTLADPADEAVELCLSGKYRVYGDEEYHELTEESITVYLDQGDPLPALQLNETVNVELSYDVTEFVFIPAFTGEYVFYSSGAEDTYGYLYNADHVQIDGDDDGGEDCNFRIECTLNEGETYYFGARSYYGGADEVALTLEHLHGDALVVEPLTAAECGVPGTERHTCAVCGYDAVIETPALQHRDKNGDLKCDLCGEDISMIKSGSLNDTVSWELWDDGTLSFAGSGSLVGWYYQSRSDVSRIVIGEGITQIGGWSFEGYQNVYEVVLPQSLKTIGSCAFFNCAAIEELTLPDGVETVNGNAFANCSSLAQLALPSRPRAPPPPHAPRRPHPAAPPGARGGRTTWSRFSSAPQRSQ